MGCMMNYRKSSHSIGNGQCVEVGGWRKAGRSMNNGNCVEVGDMRKSSHSAANNCVEVGRADVVVAVRDTTDRDGGTLMFPAGVWTAFIWSLK
jgi:uncharacterized protein DUF397